MYKLRDAQTTKSSIDVYSCSGKHINRISVSSPLPLLASNCCLLANQNVQWESGAIRGLGWSDKEELLVVAEDGVVRRYFGLHGDFTSFSLGNVSFFFFLFKQLVGC